MEIKAKLKCKTPAKAQVNYRKAQRSRMNRLLRRSGRSGRAMSGNCNLSARNF